MHSDKSILLRHRDAEKESAGTYYDGCAKAHSGFHSIIIEYVQGTEMNPVRIIIASKAEGVPAMQPPMVRITPGICLVKYCFFHNSKIM